MLKTIGIVLIVPLLLFLNGLNMVKRIAVKPMPRDNSMQLFINQGYKTGGSMRSQATWEYANKHCGNLYMRFAVITLLLGALAVLILQDKAEGVMLVQIVFTVLPLGLTEKAIEQNFDRQGNRK